MLKKIIDTARLFVVKFLGVLISSLIIFFLQKSFGNEIQGFYGVISSTVLLLTILSQFGIPSLISRKIAFYKKYKKQKVNTVISNSFKTMLIIQPLFIPVVWYQFSSFDLSFKEVFFFYIAVFSNVIIYFYAYVLRGLNDYGWMIFITETSRWVGVGFVLLVFNEWFEIRELIIYSFTFSSVLTVLIARIRLSQKGQGILVDYKSVSLARIKQITSSSSTLMFTSFGTLGLQQMNIIQLSFYNSMNDVGIYNFTFKFSAFAIMPVAVISAKYAHLASEYYYHNEMVKLKKMFLGSTLFSLGLTSVALIAIYIVSPYVYEFVELEFDLKLFIMVSASMVLFSVFSYWISFLEMINKSKETTVILLIAILSNLISNYFLTPEYSYFGTATSDLISYSIAFTSTAYLVFKFFNVRIKKLRIDHS
jgi:O-antigen/teichoic acid export membrane protein